MSRTNGQKSAGKTTGSVTHTHDSHSHLRSAGREPPEKIGSGEGGSRCKRGVRRGRARNAGTARKVNAWVTLALMRMSLDDLPPGAEDLEPAEQELLALCRELNVLNLEQEDRNDFILTVREAAHGLDGFDGERSRMRVHRLLTRVFVSEGWLEIVKRGVSKGRAEPGGGEGNVYRYLGPMAESERPEPEGAA